VLAISLLKKLILNYKNMKFIHSLALDVASCACFVYPMILIIYEQQQYQVNCKVSNK